MKLFYGSFSLVFLLSVAPLYAQEKRELNLGTGFGVPFYSFDNSGSDLLTPQNSGSWGISLYIQQQIKDTYFYESTVVTHRINSSLQINPPQSPNLGATGYPQVINNFQFNHLLLRKATLGMSKFSFTGGAGVGLNYINGKSMTFQENGFSYIRVLDEFGQNSPAYDLSVVNGQRVINSNFQLHLLAKLAISYKVSKSSSLLIFSHHGYNLASPTIENKLPEIRFEEELTSAHHRMHPLFSFVSLGYEVKLR